MRHLLCPHNAPSRPVAVTLSAPSALQSLVFVAALRALRPSRRQRYRRRTVNNVDVDAPPALPRSVAEYFLLLRSCLVVSTLADVDAPSTLFPFLVLRARFSRLPSLFPRRTHCLLGFAFIAACFTPSTSSVILSPPRCQTLMRSVPLNAASRLRARLTPPVILIAPSTLSQSLSYYCARVLGYCCGFTPLRCRRKSAKGPPSLCLLMFICLLLTSIS